MSSIPSPLSIGAPLVKHVANFRRYQWRMLFAVMFCYLFFYTGRQTFGFAIPGIQKEFGLSKEVLGWASAALLWSYAVGQAINGNLADKLGGRRVMTAGAILSCLANWVTSYAIGFQSLAIPWGVNGYLQSLGWAPGSRVLSNWWARSERGMVFGMYTFAAGCASVLSFVTSLIVVDVLHLEWRWIFRLPVILMLLGGIVFYFLARERPEDLGFDSPDTDVADARDKGATLAAGAEETSLQRYAAVLKNWRLIVASISIGFQSAARYGLIVWVPVHFLGADWAKAPNAMIDPHWITVAMPIGMALGAFSNGWISDKLFGSKRYLAIMLYMLLGAMMSLWMYSLDGHSILAIVALFLAGFFVYGPASSFWALCPDLFGSKRSGTATGVMNFFAYLFAGLGEPFIGHVLDKSGDTSQVFLIVTVACVASAMIAMFVKR